MAEPGGSPEDTAQERERCRDASRDSLSGRMERTPNTRDHHAQGPRKDAIQRQVTLVDQATDPENYLSSPPDPAQPNSGRTCWCGTLNCDQPSHKRRLNSLFTAWMMGPALHWLAPEPISYGRAATELWHSRLRLRLRFLLKGLD